MAVHEVVDEQESAINTPEASRAALEENALLTIVRTEPSSVVARHVVVRGQEMAVNAAVDEMAVNDPHVPL